MRRFLNAIGVLIALTLPLNAAQLTGNPVKDIGTAVTSHVQGAQNSTNKETLDLIGKIDALALPDFQYALELAKATKNIISEPCWQAWVDLLSARQASKLDAQGNAIPTPDPHLITDIEKLSEILGALRPDSTISTSCAALAGAAGKDVSALVGGILSGGALGLFKLPL